jgi:hypothetical protein
MSWKRFPCSDVFHVDTSAKTFSITTLSILAFSKMTLNIRGIFVTLSKNSTSINALSINALSINALSINALSINALSINALSINALRINDTQHNNTLPCVGCYYA